MNVNNDHGFTERVGTSATPASAVGNSGNSRSSTSIQKSGGSDDLQLSGFAARLNSGSGVESANRAERVGQIAKAVNGGSFQINASVVSHSIVSEGVS